MHDLHDFPLDLSIDQIREIGSRATKETKKLRAKADEMITETRELVKRCDEMITSTRELVKQVDENLSEERRGQIQNRPGVRKACSRRLAAPPPKGRARPPPPL
jgi:uncharacterized coiled-coil DUF342 family protein